MVPDFVNATDPSSIYMNGSFVALDLETDNKRNGSALVDENDIVLS